jgi:uncharacterized membrane protein YgcG
MVYEIKRIIRDFYYYARKHPMKVFMLVVMPLVTGGALANVLKQFGIRLPAGLSSVMGGRGGFGGSSFGGRSDHGGGGGGVQSLMKMAQMFI